MFNPNVDETINVPIPSVDLRYFTYPIHDA